MNSMNLKSPFEKFYQAIGKIAAETRSMIRADLRSILNRSAWEVGRTPREKYMLAGRPYGNNSRGKKRWMLEQKTMRRMDATLQKLETAWVFNTTGLNEEEARRLMLRASAVLRPLTTMTI